ncbi:MAG TPA: phosphoserine phosphatase SerB [Terriglobales bacterium]|jgi:phosphoserine phosphatase|nr:phosphoserine phosphatase SerB [Terriglobales bacterium]
MNKIILINISGDDRPGLTSSLAKILAGYNVRILDIGQAVVHDALALGMLIEVPQDFTPLKKDLLVRAHDLDLKIKFSPVSAEAFDQWVRAQGKFRFIITVLGREITAEQFARITDTVSRNNFNIDLIERLSGRLSLTGRLDNANACVELEISGIVDSSPALRAELMGLTQQFEIDIAIQRESIFRRNRRLFVFDMDSTLIEAEVIDELAKLHGVGDKVSAITASAMRGELDFKQSFTKRVALLAGLPESRLEDVVRTIPLAGGAERLIQTLKSLGYKTGVLSGGFTFFGRHLQNRLGIDYVYANELETANGAVTGRVVGEIVDGKKKAELLKMLADQENISVDQVVAVGDGANDLPMLNLAGMGIAFHAKPLVRQSASHSVSHLGLDALLYLIGVRDRDLDNTQFRSSAADA